MPQNSRACVSRPNDSHKTKIWVVTTRINVCTLNHLFKEWNVFNVEQCFRISWLREFIFCYAEYHSYQVDDICINIFAATRLAYFRLTFEKNKIQKVIQCASSTFFDVFRIDRCIETELMRYWKIEASNATFKSWYVSSVFILTWKQQLLLWEYRFK